MLDYSFDKIVLWLSKASTYPHAPKSVEMIETHISVVFLAGDFVYKLKKPVKYDFLDFTTVQQREHACREEVRLNRRLAPGFYLGVIPITLGIDGGLCLGGDGAIVNWLVHMRRLPTDRTLAALFHRGELRPQHIGALTKVLANFYRHLPPVAISPAEYRHRFAAHVQGNLEQLRSVSHHCPRDQVSRIHSFQLQLLHLEPELFDDRVSEGRIVDGHGDLLPEHICFGDPIAIFDCIEFNAEFRQIDVADELAFLAAECDYLGADWVGGHLLSVLQSIGDHSPPSPLLAFYKSYRACVRAKVAALRADQIENTRSASETAKALKHLNLADTYVQPWAKPIVWLIGGLSGTGKTTLANALAERLGCELLRTDVIRQELFLSPKGPQPGYGAGNYSADSRQQVYEEMFRRAADFRRNGVSVILDGTFSTAKSVTDAYQLSADAGSRFLAIQCVTTSKIAQERIARRLAEGQDASEIPPEYYEDQRKTWQPWPTAIPQYRVDGGQPLENQISKVLAELRRHRSAERKIPSQPALVT